MRKIVAVLSTIVLVLVCTALLLKYVVFVTYVKPTKPTPEAGVDEISEYRSVINLPVSVSISWLQDRLNDKNLVPESIRVDNIGFNAPGEIHKERATVQLNRGAVTVGAVNDSLAISFPINGSVTAKAEVCAVGTGGGIPLIGSVINQVSCHDVKETANVAGNIYGTLSNLYIDQSWQPKGVLSLKVDVTQAEVRLVGNLIKITFESDLENAINREIPKLISKLQNEILPSLNLRDKIEENWATLQQAIRVHDIPEVWVTIKPTQLYMQPISIKEGKTLQAAIAVESDVKTILGKKPETPAQPLPPIATKLLSDTFQIKLPIFAEYSVLEDQLNQCCLGKNYKIDNHISITINELHLYGGANRFIIEATLVASGPGFFDRVKGGVFLRGTPLWQKDNSTLRIVNLAYDANTSSALLEAADWLAKPAILSKLEELLVFDLSEQKKEGIEYLNEAAKTLQISKELKHDIHVTNIDLDEVILRHGDMVVVVSADGVVNFEVIPID